MATGTFAIGTDALSWPACSCDISDTFAVSPCAEAGQRYRYSHWLICCSHR
ncbi:hypothetical protein M8494_15645 [Serratia ureilytica]